MLGNWIRQTTTTTGTGSLTLSSVTGYPTFNNVFGTGRYFFYAILNDSDGSPVETGIGQMTSSTVMSRDKVLATYVSGVYDDTAPVAATLAVGTYRVICTNEAGAMQVNPLNINTSASSRILTPQTNPLPISASTLVVTADRCYYIPIVLSSPREVDAITCRVSSGSGTSTSKVGLYSAGLDGKPATLLYSSTSFSTGTGASGAAYANTITQHRPQPGLHFLAFASNGGATMNANTTSGTIPMSLLGADTTFVQGIVALYESLTGGWTNLPSTANTTLTQTTAAPTLGLRVVS